ncbi:MAG: hypothetical protein ABI651_07265 [Verrucomicrobiota bacterium]
MKMTKSILLLLGLLTSGVSGRAANLNRADINPALIYWQAFSQLPELSQEEQKLYQHSKTAPLDEKYEALVSRYDTSFRLVGRAAHLQQRVDWGVDLADGPDALLPHLAKAKVLAVAAGFRARYFLEHGQENGAVQDLLGAFVLGRQTANDGILISALVQIAIENIVVLSIAENFHGFSPDALKQLIEGMDASPARGTVSQSIGTGERALVGWFANKISELQSKYPNDEAKVISEIRDVLTLATIDEGGQKDYQKADEFIRAGGGTSNGLLALVKGVEPLYDEMQAIAALPYDRFAPANQAFFEKVEQSTNPFVKTFLPALSKARAREFSALCMAEMLRAAVQYRLDGEAGLKSVRDSFGSGPFGFRRFLFQGVDRGFELKPNYPGDYPNVLIFVEKPGPYFRVVGKTAGTAPEGN